MFCSGFTNVVVISLCSVNSYSQLFFNSHNIRRLLYKWSSNFSVEYCLISPLISSLFRYYGAVQHRTLFCYLNLLLQAEKRKYNIRKSLFLNNSIPQLF